MNSSICPFLLVVVPLMRHSLSHIFHRRHTMLLSEIWMVFVERFGMAAKRRHAMLKCLSLLNEGGRVESVVSVWFAGLDFE